MQHESVLYQTDKRTPIKDRLTQQQPKTLAEALARIATLEDTITEMQLREDVAIQGRVAAHLGFQEANPYEDQHQREFSLALIWDDAYKTEREFYLAKDKIGRLADLVIAACSLRRTLEAPTVEQTRAIKLFDITLSRIREQLES